MFTHAPIATPIQERPAELHWAGRGAPMTASSARVEPRLAASATGAHALSWSTRCPELVWWPAKLPALAAVRRAVAGDLARHGWSAEERPRVLLCLTEALANAVEHGSRRDGRMGISFSVMAREAIVRVVDEGCSGEVPSTSQSPRVPASSTHGRGILMIRALADETVIRARGNGTEVALRFSAAAAPAPSRGARTGRARRASSGRQARLGLARR